MNKIFSILAASAFLVSCSNPESQMAEKLYKEAEQAFQAGRHQKAVVLLDSIEHSCKQAIEWRKAGHTLNYQAQLAIQQDSLAAADTLLIAITAMINEMVESGRFVYEKGEYDELGRFFVKGTDTSSNLNRNYIHATVNDYGVVHLISEYRGSSYINHTRMKFIGYDKSEVLTNAVALDNEGANYHFKNQGLCHESVTYVNDPALAYVDTHSTDHKLRAALLYHNEEKCVYVDISDQDRQALAFTYQLGQMLAAQLLYTQQSKVASKKIQYLQTKLANK